MTNLFVDGIPYETFLDSLQGPIFVVALVSVEGTTLRLFDILFYPATSAPLRLEVPAVLRAFRSIENQAREEGFSKLILEAERKKPRKARRIMVINRRLL